MTRSRRRRGDETINRLLNWTEATKSSERLAGHILSADGFNSIDPSHPLGGPDNLKDLICVRLGEKWIAAAYFPNGQKSFPSIRRKFKSDIPDTEDASIGFVFVTNQELSLAQRDELKRLSTYERCDLYHLERIAQVLDRPINYGIRLEFLDIEMSKEEQVGFFGMVAVEIVEFRKQSHELLEELQRLGNDRGLPLTELYKFETALVRIVGKAEYFYPMPTPIQRLSVPLDALKEFERILSMITGHDSIIRVTSPGLFGDNRAPIEMLSVPLASLQEYEKTLDRIIEKQELVKGDDF